MSIDKLHIQPFAADEELSGIRGTKRECLWKQRIVGWRRHCFWMSAMRRRRRSVKLHRSAELSLRDAAGPANQGSAPAGIGAVCADL